MYVRSGVEVAPVPFEDMTLAEVIRQVLTKPMTAAELAVALMEADYETRMEPRALRTAIGVELRKGGFKNREGKWTNSEPSVC